MPRGPRPPERGPEQAGFKPKFTSVDLARVIEGGVQVELALILGTHVNQITAGTRANIPNSPSNTDFFARNPEDTFPLGSVLLQPPLAEHVEEAIKDDLAPVIDHVAREMTYTDDDIMGIHPEAFAEAGSGTTLNHPLARRLLERKQALKIVNEQIRGSHNAQLIALLALGGNNLDVPLATAGVEPTEYAAVIETKKHLDTVLADRLKQGAADVSRFVIMPDHDIDKRARIRAEMQEANERANAVFLHAFENIPDEQILLFNSGAQALAPDMRHIVGKENVVGLFENFEDQFDEVMRAYVTSYDTNPDVKASQYGKVVQRIYRRITRPRKLREAPTQVTISDDAYRAFMRILNIRKKEDEAKLGLRTEDGRISENEYLERVRELVLGEKQDVANARLSLLTPKQVKAFNEHLVGIDIEEEKKLSTIGIRRLGNLQEAAQAIAHNDDLRRFWPGLPDMRFALHGTRTLQTAGEGDPDSLLERMVRLSTLLNYYQEMAEELFRLLKLIDKRCTARLKELEDSEAIQAEHIRREMKKGIVIRLMANVLTALTTLQMHFVGASRERMLLDADPQAFIRDPEHMQALTYWAHHDLKHAAQAASLRKDLLLVIKAALTETNE